MLSRTRRREHGNPTDDEHQDDDAQAMDRAGLPGSKEDKGYEATAAALETAVALRPYGGS